MAEFIASLETAVPVSRSIEQIRRLVERFGAAEFTTKYAPSGAPAAVAFRVRDPHLSAERPVYLPVELRAPTDVVYRSILAGKRRVDEAVRRTAREQAERVAWRNLHDFVRASLIGVQTGIMSLGEAFMASLVITLPTGQQERLGDVAARGALLAPDAGGQLRLGAGAGA